MASKFVLTFLLILIWICSVFAHGAQRRDAWTKAIILSYVKLGANISAVATAFGTSVKSIKRWQEKYDTYGTLDYEPRRGGPKRKIKPYHVRVIKQILKRRPHTYIWEIRQQLYRRTGDRFSITQIWKRCREVRLTHKVLSKRFAESNPFAELAFWCCLSRHDIHINQLVWIDESYLCRTSGNRKRGWSLMYVLHVLC